MATRSSIRVWKIPWTEEPVRLQSITSQSGHGRVTEHTRTHEVVKQQGNNPLFFFLKQNIFKVFIEFVTVLLLFYVLGFWPQGMWDLISLTKDRTHTHCIGKRSLNHWTTRKVMENHVLNVENEHLENGNEIKMSFIIT